MFRNFKRCVPFFLFSSERFFQEWTFLILFLRQKGGFPSSTRSQSSTGDMSDSVGSEYRLNHSRNGTKKGRILKTEKVYLQSTKTGLRRRKPIYFISGFFERYVFSVLKTKTGFDGTRFFSKNWFDDRFIAA